MGLNVLETPRQAADVARRDLRLGSCPASETRFEILRATVWSMTAPKDKVHINRVLTAAIPAWRILSQRTTASEETLRTELREALSTLEDTGDLIELSGGYWAPATARFVEIRDDAGYLLVGGVPSAFLQLDDAIDFHGPHRHLAKPAAKLADVVPVEDLKSWARLPDASLLDWAREVFASLERSSYTPTSTDIFEFYRPATAKPGAPQYFRWLENAGEVTDGTLLARRRRLYGAREYRLVDVRAGRIVSACELHGIDVRRLMYALDLAAKNPVRARPVSEGMPSEWLFKSELPRAEQRMFAAFGRLTIPDDRPFERRWTFVRHREQALDLLRSLGIAID